MAEITAPRGTYDILPGESRRWQYVEDMVREIFHNYGYEEIRTPVFEHTELFVRGIGDATDVVQKEMYTFTDRGGRSLTLRPEGTASVVRAYLEHKLQGASQPVKVYYSFPMFRYERPQAGRYRQFVQFGAECIGTADPIADVEMIAAPVELYQRLGLRKFRVEINSIGCPQCRPRYREVLVEWLKQRSEVLCQTCQERMEQNPLRVLDCKEASCQEATAEAPLVTDYLCDECETHFAKVQDYLRSLEIPFVINKRLVRGLDYYTKTVFEIISEGVGAQSSIAGGGRYDGLVEDVGGQPTPAVGFAAGMDRLWLALESEKVEIPVSLDFDVYVACLGDSARGKAVDLAFALRNEGYRVDLDYQGRSLKAQLKSANRSGAKVTVILGEDELQRGVASVRNMESGEQQEVPLTELLSFCKSVL